jgi:putative ABC transport system permease protein
MRPPAPKEGKRILIERISFIWKHLSFSWKSSMRNLFRYKKRLFMTIFGIAGSMGLMLVGFGLYDSIMDIAILQYDQIQHYDAMVINDEDATDSQEKDLLKFLDGNSEIDPCAAHQDDGTKRKGKCQYLCVCSGKYGKF